VRVSKASGSAENFLQSPPILGGRDSDTALEQAVELLPGFQSKMVRDLLQFVMEVEEQLLRLPHLPQGGLAEKTRLRGTWRLAESGSTRLLATSRQGNMPGAGCEQPH
jgi:hypothetical protein